MVGHDGPSGSVDPDPVTFQLAGGDPLDPDAFDQHSTVGAQVSSEASQHLQGVKLRLPREAERARHRKGQGGLVAERR